MKKTLLLLSLTCPLSNAAVLSGTGTHLPLAGHGDAPGVPRTTVVNGGSWTGTWSSTVLSPWVGTFNVTGTVLDSNGVGTAEYDFTTLPTGILPVGTFFNLGDVDDNANSFELRAWDTSGNQMSLWLNDTYRTYGNGFGPGGTAAATDLPGWTWDSIGQSYSFDGSTVVGNPTLGVSLTNNQAIATLEVIKSGTSYGFHLRAPESVPEPSSALLSALAGGLFLFRRKRSA